MRCPAWPSALVSPDRRAARRAQSERRRDVRSSSGASGDSPIAVPVVPLLTFQHRDLVAALDLDTPSRGALEWRAEPVPLRWILFHLTEETARHNGHLDILRELADGVRGS
jgi:Protein of unknown function (DUF664)